VSALSKLRRRAEEKLDAVESGAPPESAAPRNLAATDALHLVHELQVHQIELELQNEELKQAKAEVETSLEQYTDLYDFAPVGYFSLDENGQIREVNLTGASLLGIERSRLAGRRFPLFVELGSRSDFRAFFARVFSGQEKHICEVALLKTDGPVFWAELQARSVAVPPGEPRWCRVTISEITARKRAEAARSESEARYRTLFGLIDEAFCVAELIFDRDDKPVDFRFLEVNPTFEKHTGLADASGRRMRELAPRLEEYWFETFGAVALTGEAVRFIDETKEMGGRWFDVYACRFGGPESRRIAVVLNDISERRQTEEILRQSHLALQAHADELARFNRAAVGRDLRMIELKKEINELCLKHGEPARYTLDFEEPSTPPFEDVPPKPAQDGPAGDPMAGPVSEVPRLVIAEDDHGMREYLLKLLESHYRVEAFADGRTALDSVLAHPPDVVLTDVTMPHLDGLDLLRRLRAEERTRDIPVVMLSGRSSEEAREEGMVTGADDYLIKPFSARELLARLNSQLELARLRRENERHHRDKNAELARRVEELQLANTRTRESRRAALNLMEDAIESRRIAEALTLQVRESEIRYRRLFEAALDGVLLLDPATRKITDANPFMSNLLGYLHEELVGKELFEIGLLKDEAASQAMVRKLKRNGQVRYEHLPLVCRDGHRQEVEVVANLYQEDGRAVIQCNIRDITERKRAEETKRGLEVMTASNAKLKEEIVRRRAVETALTRSERRARLLLEQARALQAKLRDLSRRMMGVEEEQRKKISRELHDDISQLLVGIIVHLGNVTKAAALDPESIQKTITPLLRMVEESVRVVHRFARELRPAMLDDLGLVPALEAYIHDFPEVEGRRIEFTAFEGAEDLDIEKRTMLYRVAQEALTNVAKHAHASLVRVSLVKNRGRVRLVISDDGRAFDTRLIASPEWRDHLGLVGMRERVEMVGGRFEIVSEPGAGTTIRAEVPTGRTSFASGRK
jgi:PAS domain S-box-containing protein